MTKPVLNIGEVLLRQTRHEDKFEAKLARLGPQIGASKLGCQLHVVPPGKKAFPFHAHHVNEEMFFVLEGEGVYRIGKDRYPIRANDLISAPAGDASTAHQIVNTSNGDLRYLAFSTRLDPEVLEYPDSKKFAVASMVPEDRGFLGARVSFIGRMENSIDYYDGET